MDFFETIEQRRSVRAFEPREVGDADVTRILEAANRAPSAGNLQAYEVVVVRETERRRRLARAAHGQEFVAQAPVVLVFCVNPKRSGGRYGSRGRELYSLQDATIAAAHASLPRRRSDWLPYGWDPSTKRAPPESSGRPSICVPSSCCPSAIPGNNPWPRRAASSPNWCVRRSSATAGSRRHSTHFGFWIARYPACPLVLFRWTIVTRICFRLVFYPAQDVADRGGFRIQM